jgi:cytochrome c oxidase assembly protein Cox11
MARGIDTQPPAGRSNARVAAVCVAFVAGMVGMSYAAVPLYALFCQVTGYGGTTQRVEQYSDTVIDRTITIRFDANTSGVPWDFRPEQRDVTLKIGETAHVAYKATNTFSVPTGGRATFNVTPSSPAPISTRSNASASPTPRCSPAKRWTCRWCSSSIRRSTRCRN